MKKVVAGLSLLIVIWVGNIYYYQVNQLNNPIFIEHYYEKSLHENDGRINFSLYYLRNSEDQNTVNYIQIPDTDVFVNVLHENTYSTNRYQTLQQVMVEINYEQWKNVIGEDDIKINELDVSFSDGTRETMNVGEIKYIVRDDSINRLATPSTGGSSDHTGYTTFEVPKSFSIVDVHLPFADHLQEDLTLTINGEKLTEVVFPIELNDKSSFRTEYAFRFDEDNKHRLHFYDIEARIIGETVDGEKGIGSLYMNYFPYFSDADVKELIAERSGENE